MLFGRSRKRREFYAFAYVVLGTWALLCLFPLYWIAVTSLQSEQQISNGPFYLPFVDFEPSLEGWSSVLANPFDNLFLRYLNSAVIGLTSTLLTVCAAGLAIYGMTRFQLSLRWTSLALSALISACIVTAVMIPTFGPLGFLTVGFILLWFLLMRLHRRGPVMPRPVLPLAMLATRILPPIVVVLPIYLMVQRTGLLDTRPALIFIYTAANLPVAIWLLQPIFGDTATEQEESAQLDGASHLRIFFTISVPMAATGITAVGLIIFILCWNEYLFAAFLTADRTMTMPPWLAAQMSVREAQVGGDTVEQVRLSAATLLMIAPVLVGAALIQRFVGRMSLERRRF
jgi:multiple sugar transport system permease protein